MSFIAYIVLLGLLCPSVPFSAEGRTLSFASLLVLKLNVDVVVVLDNIYKTGTISGINVGVLLIRRWWSASAHDDIFLGVFLDYMNPPSFPSSRSSVTSPGFRSWSNEAFCQSEQHSRPSSLPTASIASLPLLPSPDIDSDWLWIFILKWKLKLIAA